MGRPRKNAVVAKAAKPVKAEKAEAAPVVQLKKVQAPRTSLPYTLVSFKPHDNGNADIVVKNEKGKFTFTGVFKTIGWKPRKNDEVIVERQPEGGTASCDFSVLKA